MENLKIRVESEYERLEAQELFFKLGYKPFKYPKPCIYLVSFSDGDLCYDHSDLTDHKEITLDQLRQMVNPVKEYLDTAKNYTYVQDTAKRSEDWIEIPEGANFYSESGFFKDKSNWWSSHHEKWVNHDDRNLKFIIGEILWTRPTKPEELPFIDDEPQDNVNHPNHYSNSSIECIDAMEAMLTPEQFIGYLRGNIFKYQWRYENKNGIEDLRKSEWYFNKLLEKLNEN